MRVVLQNRKKMPFFRSKKDFNWLVNNADSNSDEENENENVVANLIDDDDEDCQISDDDFFGISDDSDLE